MGSDGVLLLREESEQVLRDYAREIPRMRFNDARVGYIAQVEILKHNRGKGLVDELLESVTAYSKDCHNVLFSLV